MLKKDDDQALAEQRYYIVPDVQEHETAKEVIKKLAESLCEQYPEISTFKGVFNGKPHLKDTRFTVADVLSAICIYNDLGSVLEAYDNEYTEEQFKAAIRYARDFLLSSYSLP